MRKIITVLKWMFFAIILFFALLPICYFFDWCSSFMPWLPPFWEWLSGVSVMYFVKFMPRSLGGALPVLLHICYIFTPSGKANRSNKSSTRREILLAHFFETPLIMPFDLQKIFTKHIMLHYASCLMPKGKKSAGDIPFKNIKSVYSYKTKKQFYNILFMFAKVKTKMLGIDDSYIYYEQSLFYKKRIIAQLYSKFAFFTLPEDKRLSALKKGYVEFPIISPQEYFDDIGYTHQLPSPSERIKKYFR